MFRIAIVQSLMAMAKVLTAAYECNFSNPGFYSVKSMYDLVSIQECDEFYGDLQILGYEDSIVDLGHIQEVHGDIQIRDSSALQQIVANDLNAVYGDLQIHALYALGTISAPQLKYLESLEVNVAPVLSTMNIGDIISCPNVVISDTSLTSIDQFSAQVMEVLNVNNNRYLKVLQSDVNEISDRLEVSGNGKDLQVFLPELISAKNATIKSAHDLEMSQVEYINASLYLQDNSFTTIELPALKSISASLGITGNRHLQDIKMPKLQHIYGGMVISNNSNLHEISHFDSLRTIGGGMEVYGSYTIFQLPAIERIQGSARLVTDISSFNCDIWTEAKQESIIEGDSFVCSNGVSSNRYAPINHIKDSHYTEGNSTTIPISNGARRVSPIPSSSISSGCAVFSVLAWITMITVSLLV